ncbi:MAG: CorA family divalent cation transporter [Candidatus Berkiella sp.]
MMTKITYDRDGNLAVSQNEKDKIIWIDVFEPNNDDRHYLENEYNISLPFHYEMNNIEFSNRFFEENNGVYLSFNVVTTVIPVPESHVVTFILTKSIFVTLRFSNPSPTNTFISQLTDRKYYAKSPIEAFQTLFTVIIGKIADLYQIIDEKSENLAFSLIRNIDKNKKDIHKKDLNKTLREINLLESLLSKIYQSLSSLSLLATFFEKNTSVSISKEMMVNLEKNHNDIRAMLKHGEYLNQKLGFQLQSTLGLINIEQTNIIKFFTILATIFIPPTLVSNIFGMNFKGILDNTTILGYVVAFILMSVFSYGVYVFVKRKRWLE